jgi:hypothetical protein
MTYKISYTGQLVSSNKFYSSGHWAIRSAIKNKWISIYSALCLEAKMKPFKSFDLRVIFNSRHDIDNVGANIKLLADSLKGKYIKDDSPDYFQSMSIKRDKSLPKNTIEFYIDTHD